MTPPPLCVLSLLVNQTLRKVKYRSECSVLDEFQTSTEFDMNLQYHLDNQFYFVYFVIHDKIMWRVYITGYLLGEEKLQPNKYPYDPPNRLIYFVF